MAFQCTVVTPEHQAFDASVAQAILPAHDGLLGILTNRAPLLVKLGHGPLRLDRPDGHKEFFFVAGGIAQMKDNKLTIVTGEATPAAEIDYESARAEYAAATAQRAADPAAAKTRQERIELARARMQAAEKR